jgi:hypothetical protein
MLPRRYVDKHDEHQTRLMHLFDEKINAYTERHKENLVVVADEHNMDLAA